MTNEQVDTHDPAGMARWLRERSEAAQFFTTLNTAAQRLQFLELWQVNVLPHLAFRFKQAAEMVEHLAADCLELIEERDRLNNKVAALTIVAYGTPENPKLPAQRDLDPESKHALYSNLRELARAAHEPKALLTQWEAAMGFVAQVDIASFAYPQGDRNRYTERGWQYWSSFPENRNGDV